MALAGYATTLEVSGAPVEMTSEPLTSLGVLESGFYGYQITNAAHRVLDPDTEIVVTVDSLTVASNEYLVDYFSGLLTFFTEPASAPVLEIAAYLPLLTVAEARSVSLEMSRVELDTSLMGTAETDLLLGQKSASGSLVSFRLLEETIDAEEDLPTWQALQDDDTPKLLEVGMGTEFWRGWVRFPGLQEEAPSDGVTQATITFKSSARRAAGRNEVVAYGFGE